MSDKQLRELERAFAASGDPEDEQRLLAHRVRAGLLHPAWLEAAARLGHAPARRALGRFVPILDERGLVEALPLLGRRAAVIGLVPFARARLDAWRSLRPGDDRPDRALDAAEAWARAEGAAADALWPAASSSAGAAAEAAEEVMRAALEVHAFQALADAVPAAEAARRAAGAAWIAGGAEPEWLECARGALERRPDATREVRDALVPWVLGPPPGVTPPAWPAPLRGALDPSAAREAEEAFEATLASKAVRSRATALRRRLKEKELERAQVDVAAALADPAAWLVMRTKAGARRPDLTPVEASEEVGRRLTDLLDRHAAPVKKRVPQRRHWTDDGGRERSAVGWRTEQAGPARWPAWSGRLLARAALALVERVATDSGPDGDAALEAVRAWYRDPGEARAAEAAARAKALGGRRTKGVTPAARALAAACALVAAREPGAAELGVLTAAVEAAGVGPGEQWALVRTALVAWAVGEDRLGPTARPYAPAERYAEGERVAHPRFGEGRVVRVLGDKVEVDFGGEPRTLVHGRV